MASKTLGQRIAAYMRPARHLIGLWLHPREVYQARFAGVDSPFPMRSVYARRWFLRYRGTATGWHEPAVTRLMEVLVRRHRRLLDVGAHLGWFSVLFASVHGRDAHAIELDPSNYAALSDVLSVQPADRKIVARNLGLSDAAGVARMPVGGHSAKSSLRSSGGGFALRRKDVPLETMDRYVDEMPAPPGVIKIDVEGFEDQVLAGGARTLARHPAIIMEIHPEELARRGRTAAAVVEALLDAGLSVFRINAQRTAAEVSLEPWPFELRSDTAILAAGPDDIHALRDVEDVHVGETA